MVLCDMLSDNTAGFCENGRKWPSSPSQPSLSSQSPPRNKQKKTGKLQDINSFRTGFPEMFLSFFCCFLASLNPSRGSKMCPGWERWVGAVSSVRAFLGNRGGIKDILCNKNTLGEACQKGLRALNQEDVALELSPWIGDGLTEFL